MKQALDIDEYQVEILGHLSSLQGKMSPNLLLIQQQPEVNLKMRPLLLDFLMDVINKLNLSTSTFPLTVNLIDRYCSTRIVKKQHYQLLGLTSLWISCKNLDSKMKIPSLMDLCKMCCNCYDKKLFLEMENHLLKSLGWMVSSPTFDLFSEHYIEQLQLNGYIDRDEHANYKTLAVYVCELIQFYPNIYFYYNSSQVALGGLLTSMLVCKVPVKVDAILSYLHSFLDKLSLLDYQGFLRFYESLMKILKCPPPSLKLKYFNEHGSSLKLMKIMINFVNEQTAATTPITPKFQIHQQSNAPTYQSFPRTPVSNNISPRIQLHTDGAGTLSIKPDSYTMSYDSPGNKLLPSPKSSPEHLSYCIPETTPPNAVLPRLNIPGAPTDDVYQKKRTNQDTPIESPNKKSRSRKSDFYIS